MDGYLVSEIIIFGLLGVLALLRTLLIGGVCDGARLYFCAC